MQQAQEDPKTKLSLHEKIANLPMQPGVYQFFDKEGRHLYIGKAKRLRPRVQSYVRESADHAERIRLMVSKIRNVEVIVTDSEGEALILENQLIKEHQPRYNVMFRDDKTYPYICLTREDRPRVYPTRVFRRDGSKYFGPYDHVGHMRRMLEMIRKTFGLCTCAVSAKTIDPTRGVPKWHTCFNDYIRNCSGDDPEELYRETMKKVERLLGGRTEALIRDMKEEMSIASDAMHYEDAALLRDGIESLMRYNQKMKMVDSSQVNRDLFAVEIEPELNEACGVLFKIREGKLIGRFHRLMKNAADRSRAQLIQYFMEDYYTSQDAEAIPDEVFVSDLPENSDPLIDYLAEQLGRKVVLHLPKIGEKKQFVEMALRNARHKLGERILEKQKQEKTRIPMAVQDLKTYLHLHRLPRRIECFDNSNIQGSDPVASMVVFVDGQPRKSAYKRFMIKTVEGPDDFASMKEIVKRRYSRVMREGQQAPDLILIDGGKGQLNAALEALREIGFEGQCEVAGLAKRLEEVFLPGRMDAVMIPKVSPALKLLQRARDEAHRFAITFHREKRRKRTLQTELTSIEGVGVKTAEKLLKEFGSVQAVREASREELERVVSKKISEAIQFHWKSDR
jgi:excinuclease ABC subunit C